MKKIINFLLILVLIILSTGCNKQQDDTLNDCSDLVLELVCLSYDNYGDYSKLPSKYQKLISKELFESLNYRDEDYTSMTEYGKYGVDYYAINSLSYPEAEFDGDDVVVNYYYTYICRPYGNISDYKLPGSKDIPVKVTLKKIDEKYCVVDYWEKP